MEAVVWWCPSTYLREWDSGLVSRPLVTWHRDHSQQLVASH